MLDIKYIRENPELIRKGSQAKHIPCDVDALVAVDGRRRELQQELDGLRQQTNEMGAQVGLYRNQKWLDKQGLPREQAEVEALRLQERLTEIKQRSKGLEQEQQELLARFTELMARVPQPPDPEAPYGEVEGPGVELRRWGTVTTPGFKGKDHVELGQALDIIDLERGVRLAGSRNYVLKGDGARLYHAVLRLGCDMLIERGYVPVQVPVLVKEEAMYGTGYFPGGRDQAYLCERDGLSLVGTAEVSLTALHGGEILSEDQLPLRYFAVSTCFRREAGAAGKDTYGLYRVHVFDKVEQVVIGRNDVSESRRLHQEILQNAEDIMQKLEIPYRVVNVCTGDLGLGQVQKFDIEAWMPSRDSYGETHSASRFYEFQARRLNMRYKTDDKKNLYCHTLNNTMIALPRVLIPLLELNQRSDGSVRIPAALRPYMGGQEVIAAAKSAS
jgi:seryl-tRNA synthetase